MSCFSIAHRIIGLATWLQCVSCPSPNGEKKKGKKKKTYRVVVGLEVVANLPSGVPVATKTGLPKKEKKKRQTSKVSLFKIRKRQWDKNAQKRCKDPDP